MLNKRTKFLLFLSFILIGILSVSCGNGQSEQASEPVTIRVAVLPILDTLPMYVAQQEGLFSEQNLSVEFIPVASAPERDQIITAGKADAMINELVSTIFYNQIKSQIQIVRYARVATADQPVFRIITAAESGITSAADLKGVKIGISEGTIIEYLTDRLLQAEGLTDEEIVGIAVPKIPDRLALLGSGKLAAAMLPDPASAVALANGGMVAIDDTSHPEYGFSVISFRKEFIDANESAVSSFMAALEEATELINTDPSQYAELLAEKNLIPPPVLATYQLPKFPAAGVPTEAQWDDAVDWVTTKGLLNGETSYSTSVNADFLP
jgi:NitT/TauT family transport system substrate-binding protein